MSEFPLRLIDLPTDDGLRVRPIAETVLRPMGLSHGRDAEMLVEVGLAEWLAGGPCAFSAVEIAEGSGATRERELRSVRQVALLRSPNVAGRLRLLCDARQPVAGLSWVRPRIMATLALVSGRGQSGERTVKAAVQRGRLLAAAGADIIALSAPRGPRNETHERERIEPVVAELAEEGIRVAVATARPSVMRAAVQAGARVIIDDAPRIDEELVYTLGDLGVPVILRRVDAIRDVPRDERDAVDLAIAVHAALEEHIEMFEGAGIPRNRLIVDPGTEPGRPPAQRLALLHSAAVFHGLGCVLLADCAGLHSNGGSADYGGGLEDVDMAFAALTQGVQLISTDDPARAWAAASAFQALAVARLDGTE